MTLPQDIIGVDIAKGWIDTFTLSTRKHERITVTKPALARFAGTAAGTLVVFEASGGYERPLTGALARAGVTFARANPRQAREYARATGRLAKTDRVDAEVLARMGRALELPPPLRRKTLIVHGFPISWPAATISSPRSAPRRTGQVPPAIPGLPAKLRP
jgi:transposase